MSYLALILFNIVFFICNIYPKHIFEIGSALSVISIALNSEAVLTWVVLLFPHAIAVGLMP